MEVYGKDKDLNAFFGIPVEPRRRAGSPEKIKK